MQSDDSRIKSANKIRASLAISSATATPEELLTAVQKQLPAFKVTVAGSTNSATVQTRGGIDNAIE